eukprot:CAMPEP_0198683302 /NCGR_PEP_ID=MMETSP1468-20131203/10365_1 /TAXON_ID=1461545 /ORGANISM="Mantoniella sp, Strain CCMP1436" /LENGTH=214 /DNA_ID=CAMNT_0044427173 /DNA_START=119 /DNA_END=763 /DNA_ORIENTATION=-
MRSCGGATAAGALFVVCVLFAVRVELLTTEVRIAREEVKQLHTQMMRRSLLEEEEQRVGRALLITSASADDLTHTGSSASNTLTLSSLNAAVDVKAAASKDVTMSPGNSLKATFSSVGDLQLHAGIVAAKGFQSKNGRTTYTSTGPNLTPEIYRTVGTDHDCTHPGNRGTIWVQRCQLVSLGANQNQDCLCFCGHFEGWNYTVADSDAAMCINP